MGTKHSNDDLDLLTDEEREGLLDDGVIDEGLEADDGDDAAGGDASADAEASGDGAVDDVAEARKADQDDAAAAAGGDIAEQRSAAEAATVEAAEPGGDADAEAADEEERTASWVLPAEVGQKLEELDKARDILSEQFDDGELTAKEYREKLKPIEKELDALKEQRTAANVQRDIAISTYKDVTVPAFLKDHPEYADKESPLYGMLDATLRKLQQASRDPLSPLLLQRAHEQISGQLKKALGIAEIPKAKTPPVGGKQPPAKRDIPPTLANVPAADISDADDGGEFAYLDRLANSNVEKYEAALAKMPDDARERYLAQ